MHPDTRLRRTLLRLLAERFHKSRLPKRRNTTIPSIPLASTVFTGLVAFSVSATRDFGSLSTSAIRAQTSSFALPSTEGAVTKAITKPLKNRVILASAAFGSTFPRT